MQSGQVSAVVKPPAQLVPSGTRKPIHWAGTDLPSPGPQRGDVKGSHGTSLLTGQPRLPWECLQLRVEGNLVSTPAQGLTSMGLATMSLINAKCEDPGWETIRGGVFVHAGRPCAERDYLVIKDWAALSLSWTI